MEIILYSLWISLIAFFVRDASIINSQRIRFLTFLDINIVKGGKREIIAYVIKHWITACGFCCCLGISIILSILLLDIKILAYSVSSFLIYRLTFKYNDK